jgi:hypothetical protein
MAASRQRLGDTLRRGEVDVSDGHAVAIARERPRCRLTNTAAAAGNNRNPAHGCSPICFGEHNRMERVAPLATVALSRPSVRA